MNAVTPNQAAAMTASKTTQTTIPQIVHRRWTCLNWSALSQRLLRQAHALPFAPSTKGMTRLTTGTNISSAMNVLLPMPQIQFSRKAPQFQRSSSGGMTAATPWPDVLFSMMPRALARLQGFAPGIFRLRAELFLDAQ